MSKITAKAAARAAEKTIISRMKSPAELGKPEGLSGTVLTLRMIDSAIQSAAQAAASRAAAEALADEVRQLKDLSDSSDKTGLDLFFAVLREL